jgi:valyl-tRNA synthetase
MENIRDWCISRQLWWGHRIPAYFYGDGPDDFVVTLNPVEAVKIAREKSGNPGLRQENLRQDGDVLDTWFSSWLWPISVFDGIRNPDNADMKYYYPTNDLITAPEILFFWVARMIIAGYEYAGERPFKNVYLTGIVRDQKRRKMSKSLGNSPDPLELIQKYSADGVRVGMLLCSPAGNDLLFDESLTLQGRNFGNKIWNASRLVKMWTVDEALSQPPASAAAVRWFDAKLNQVINRVESNYQHFRLSEALMNVYKLFWDEFASWYLEIVKPDHARPIDRSTCESTIDFMDKLVHLLHPFMPFITEEIWHIIRERRPDESLMVSEMPAPAKPDARLIAHFELVKEVVSNIRLIRNRKNIPVRTILELYHYSTGEKHNDLFDPVICKLAGLTDIRPTDKKMEDAGSFMVKNVEYYVPLGDMMDIKEELAKLEKELAYARGFLESVMKKLSNESFVQNAPGKVIEIEKNKKADAEIKILSLEKQIGELRKKRI